MSITRLTLDGFPPPPPSFCHVSVAPAGRTVYVSGQVGTDEEGRVVAGGLAAQLTRALENVARALDGAGAPIDALASLRVYVVGWDPSMIGDLLAGGEAARANHPWPPVPVTLIGVASLFTPEHLVEVEAVAVLDA
jgi:enamine deaminase RidA (YjgF/YER057c/UK114 family)